MAVRVVAQRPGYTGIVITATQDELWGDISSYQRAAKAQGFTLSMNQGTGQLVLRKDAVPVYRFADRAQLQSQFASIINAGPSQEAQAASGGTSMASGVFANTMSAGLGFDPWAAGAPQPLPSLTPSGGGSTTTVPTSGGSTGGLPSGDLAQNWIGDAFDWLKGQLGGGSGQSPVTGGDCPPGTVKSYGIGPGGGWLTQCNPVGTTDPLGPQGPTPTGASAAAGGVVPTTVSETVRRCPRGPMGEQYVLAKDGLCYPKRMVPKALRLYPPAPKPAVSAQDVKAIRRADRARKRLVKLTNQSGAHASLTKPRKGSSRRALPAPASSRFMGTIPAKEVTIIE